MKIKVTEISLEEIECVLANVNYSGNFAFKCTETESVKLYNECEKECFEDKLAYVLENGGTIEVYDHNTDDEEDYYKPHSITKKDLLRGYNKLPKWALGDYLTEGGDTNTDLALIECTLFGEVVYG